MIKSNKTNRIYIGLTGNLSNRKIQHKYQLVHNTHSSTKMQEDFNLYGFEQFEFIELKSGIEDFNTAGKLEQFYIELYNSIEEGYNSMTGGGGKDYTKITEEERKKFSELFLDIANRPEIKIAASKRMSALWKEDWFREKMAELNKGNTYNLGKPLSDETKRKISEHHKGEGNPFYGKQHTEETKKKLSRLVKDRFCDEKARKNHHDGIMKFIHSEEYRKKQSLLSQGRSNKTTERDAVTIRLRYLNGERPVDIHKDFPKLSISGVKKICQFVTWKHIPNNVNDLKNMLINYQS